MESLTKKSEIFGDITFRGDGCTLDQVKQRLFDYEDAEEQGLLIRLPCKIGDTVYEVYQFCGDGAWEIDEHKIKLEDLNKIGKTVFLTREGAEAALERMNGGENGNE